MSRLTGDGGTGCCSAAVARATSRSPALNAAASVDASLVRAYAASRPSPVVPMVLVQLALFAPQALLPTWNGHPPSAFCSACRRAPPSAVALMIVGASAMRGPTVTDEVAPPTLLSESLKRN